MRAIRDLQLDVNVGSSNQGEVLVRHVHLDAQTARPQSIDLAVPVTLPSKIPEACPVLSARRFQQSTLCSTPPEQETIPVSRASQPIQRSTNRYSSACKASGILLIYFVSHCANPLAIR
jgi:hypothetical protein